MSYQHTFGPAVDRITTLGWGLGSVSVLVIIIVSFLLLTGIFRKRAGDLAHSELTVKRDAGGMVWIYWGVGASTIVLLGCVGWTMSVTAAVTRPLPESALTIEVSASQWWWKARYNNGKADQIFTIANEIHIPTGQPIRIQLVSTDVIHSFWIPKLAGKMDVIPGQTNVSWLQADQPGTYRGQCAAFCGVQHAHMALFVIADTPDVFKTWEENQLREHLSSANADVGRGEKIFQQRCGICHTVRGISPAGIRGPDLTHLMSRHTLAAGELQNTPENLAKWVSNAQAIKAGALMPKLNLSKSDLEAVTTYLRTLT